MSKIVKVKEIISIAKELRKQNKTIVVTGGCFDLLHIGHIVFLEHAKKHADVLFVLLENDQVIRVRKGKNRPIYSQKDRAKVLQALSCVDYILPLPPNTRNQKYDELLFKLKPTIIATTKGDSNRKHKERQANLLGISVLDVIKRIPNRSTSRLARILSMDQNL